MTGTATGAEPIRTLDDAEGYVALICFKHGPPRKVGVELEWTVHHRDGHARPLDPHHLAAALGDHAPRTVAPHSPQAPLPHGSQVTVEPGGQVELSSLPATSVTDLVDAVDADLGDLDTLLAPAGLVRGSGGIDAHRRPDRLLTVPRYVSMQAFFDQLGPWGSTMMCSTASTQVCVDAGEPGEHAVRWRALHAVGPALVALFANSPVVAGRDTGWASNRLRSTLRTCPPFTGPLPGGEDPVTAWVRSAMQAPVLCVRRAGDCWDPPRQMSFAEWVTGPVEPAPTYDDLDYHLSTLFPPVRPRGYVEIRYLDAQPSRHWHHPLVLLAALLSSPRAVERALELAEHSAGLWLTAAREGLRSCTLRHTARALVSLAAEHMHATGVSPALAEPVLTRLDRRTSIWRTGRLPA